MIVETKTRKVTEEDIHKMTNEEKLKAVDFFVEADGYAVQSLWEKYYYDKKETEGYNSRLEWIQDKSGFMKHIGDINGLKDMPVTCEFSFYIINGKYICFYSPGSNYVDWKMIENWIDTNYPIKYDTTRRARTNAMNFHNCHNFCKD
jgi:hypothetical protein